MNLSRESAARAEKKIVSSFNNLSIGKRKGLVLFSFGNKLRLYISSYASVLIKFTCFKISSSIRFGLTGNSMFTVGWTCNHFYIPFTSHRVERVRWQVLQDEWRLWSPCRMVYLIPVKSTSLSRLRLSWHVMVAGYNLRCCVVSDWARQPTKRRKTPYQTSRKATGNHLALFFPRHDRDCAIVSEDNGVNEAVSQGLEESRSAGNDIKSSR